MYNKFRSVRIVSLSIVVLVETIVMLFASLYNLQHYYAHKFMFLDVILKVI